jgi:nucleotide-binding universal stress UspA family protein
VAHAWDLWGEGLLRHRVPKEEIEEGRADTKRSAEQALERVLSQCELDGVVPERLLGRGDPTRVIAGAVDLVKPGLVVLGSTAKEGVKGTLLGNTAEAIARQKHSSVLIIR